MKSPSESSSGDKSKQLTVVSPDVRSTSVAGSPSHSFRRIAACEVK